MKAALLACAILAACSDEGSSTDVRGPFTGPTHRYVVDSFTFAVNNNDARDVAADLDGDQNVDNKLGQAIAFLRQYNNITNHAADMIAAGTIASSVEIVADDLVNDETVSVRYIGADGAPSTPMGGTLVDETFLSNRAAVSDHPGATELHLPVFRTTDPSVLPFEHMEIDLVPDDAGGFNAVIRGAIPEDEAYDVATSGIAAMILSHPSSHLVMYDLYDLHPKDGVVTVDEVRGDSLVGALLTADLNLARKRFVSLAFAAHLRPCDDGNCAASEPFDRCFDRQLDGDETAIDCGGSCTGCQTGDACTEASDCESRACDAGHCGPPSCTNSSRDGFETDVDCGSGCGLCASGKGCVKDSDCQSGSCGVPVQCHPGDLFCIDVDFYDTCY